MFKTAKISALIAWGFGIVIALIVVMVAVTYLKSDVVKSDATRMVHDVNPKVSAAAAIRLNVLKNWANTLVLLETTDAAEAQLINKEMAANSKLISEKFEFLDKTMLAEPGRSYFMGAIKARKDYTDNRKKYLDLLKAGSKDEAHTFLLTSLRPNLDAYIDSTGKVFEYQSEKMLVISQDTLAEMSSMELAMLIIAVIVVGVSISAAVVVVSATNSILGGDAHYANQVAKEIAAGNLSVEVSTRPEDKGSLLSTMKSMRDGLRSFVADIQNSARQVEIAAQHLSQASIAVAHASSQQSESVSATAAAVEQLTAGIESVASGANSASTYSHEADELAQKGGEVIQNAAAELKKIAGSVESSSLIIASLEQQSGEIASVVNVIKEIADQTNLLALNAAIEAARAGEQGRGFAVVADEVRKLAERTTNSTREIALTIEKIQAGTKSAVESMVSGVDQVKAGTTLAVEAGASIRDIQSGAQKVVAVVNDISNSLKEQTIAGSEISRNIESIATMVEENHSSSESAAQAAADLQTLADKLSASVRSFRT